MLESSEPYQRISAECLTQHINCDQANADNKCCMYNVCRTNTLVIHSTVIIENKFLQNKFSESKSKILELEERNKVLKLAKSLGENSGKTTDVKLKINELVREIDTCIALVNN